LLFLKAFYFHPRQGQWGIARCCGLFNQVCCDVVEGGLGDGVDAGQQHDPEDKARQQNNGPNVTAIPLHFKPSWLLLVIG
jgi:hypothetical protein